MLDNVTDRRDARRPVKSRVSSRGRHLVYGLLVSALLMAVIGAVDLIFRSTSPKLMIVAALDSTAHLATALLLIGFCPRLPSGWTAGYLTAVVLIDVDHAPGMLGYGFLGDIESRPFTHSLAVPAVLAITILVLRGNIRMLTCGVAFGLMAHLFRDLATGGVLLLWPASVKPFELSYGIYLGTLVLAAPMAAARFALLPAHRRLRNESTSADG